ncbi:unnamed protein product [Clonostachys byssicola]|uniref:Transcriptional regulator n=1 Tax=Clonostachys byssicola TaxID=160290 RepID=A0A9N9UTJ7_9HYPO|nr:unnamed protein product [Clonostachys byssicola]
MYLRDVHAEKDLRVLRQLVRENPLGMITTAIKSPHFPFLQTSHIPFVLEVEDEESQTELGRLKGHLARANPQSKAIIEEVNDRHTKDAVKILENDVLVIFNSPIQSYSTPKFYTETKPSTGKVVPTWNYAAVQIYGKATVYVDPKAAETSAFLDSQMRALTYHNEVERMGYNGKGGNPGPWEVSDAPEKYIELLKKAIIGIDIKIEHMGGKFKMSQEMNNGDTEGIIKGFRNLGTEMGGKVADLVEERRDLKNKAKAET